MGRTYLSPHCLKRCAVVAASASTAAAMKHNPALKFMDRIGQDCLLVDRNYFPLTHLLIYHLISFHPISTPPSSCHLTLFSFFFFSPFSLPIPLSLQAESTSSAESTTPGPFLQRGSHALLNRLLFSTGGIRQQVHGAPCCRRRKSRSCLKKACKLPAKRRARWTRTHSVLTAIFAREKHRKSTRATGALHLQFMFRQLKLITVDIYEPMNYTTASLFARKKACWENAVINRHIHTVRVSQRVHNQPRMPVGFFCSRCCLGVPCLLWHLSYIGVNTPAALTRETSTTSGSRLHPQSSWNVSRSRSVCLCQALTTGVFSHMGDDALRSLHFDFMSDECSGDLNNRKSGTQVNILILPVNEMTAEGLICFTETGNAAKRSLSIRVYLHSLSKSWAFQVQLHQVCVIESLH